MDQNQLLYVKSLYTVMEKIGELHTLGRTFVSCKTHKPETKTRLNKPNQITIVCSPSVSK